MTTRIVNTKEGKKMLNEETGELSDVTEDTESGTQETESSQPEDPESTDQLLHGETGETKPVKPFDIRDHIHGGPRPARNKTNIGRLTL